MIVCFPRILRWVPGGRIIRYGAAAVRAHRNAALTCIVVGGAVGLASAPVWAPAYVVPPSAPEAAYVPQEPFLGAPDFGAPRAGAVGGFVPAVWGVSLVPGVVQATGGLPDVDCDSAGRWDRDRAAIDGDLREVAPPAAVTPVPEPAWVLVAPGIVLAFCRRVR